MEITENTIYNCDCMELMQEMVAQGIKAKMLLTDIPYDAVNRKTNGLRNLDKENADILTFNLNDFLKLTNEVVSDNFVIFCGINQISEIRNFYNNLG